MKNMKKNIAILAGGNSSESEISIKSASQIIKNIDTTKYNPYLVAIKELDWKVIVGEVRSDIDKNDFSFMLQNEKIKFDCIFIAIHGTPGEDGLLQAYFDLLKIPYTSCDSICSTITFDKWTCNNFLKNFDINIAKSWLCNSKTDIKELEKKINYPCFVKPSRGGSSFGVSKVKKAEELQNAINKAKEECESILIEEFIDGTEITCGIFKGKDKEIIFSITEIVSKNEFFDYEAKYITGKSEEITPARISKEMENICKETTSQIYDLLNCKGIVRVDYIISKKNALYFLEINTIPGMTEQSIIPKQAKEYGIELKELYSMMIEEAVLVG